MKYCIVLLFLPLISCGTNSEPIENDLLAQEWVHFFEEDVDLVQFYRPADYMEFPLARYRQRYILDKSGRAEWSVLSPFDAHYLEYGKWSYNEKENQLILTDFNGQIKRKLDIVKVEEDLLKLLPN